MKPFLPQLTPVRAPGTAALVMGLLVSATGFLRGATPLPAVIDWDTEAWAPQGAVTQSVLRNDTLVEWEFTGDTGEFNNASPRSSNRLQGGDGANSLEWRFDPEFQTQSITLEIRFVESVGSAPVGVTDVSMLLYDIDRDKADLADSQWADRLTIIGHTSGGGTTDPVFSAPGSTVQVESATSLIGTGKAGNKDADGNVTVGFGVPVESITIRFEDGGAGNFKKNKDHEIGIRNIEFTPIPEPSSLFLLVLSASGMLLISRRKSW